MHGLVLSQRLEQRVHWAENEVIGPLTNGEHVERLAFTAATQSKTIARVYIARIWRIPRYG